MNNNILAQNFYFKSIHKYTFLRIQRRYFNQKFQIKKLLFLPLLFAFIFLFTVGCKKDDGVNPLSDMDSRELYFPPISTTAAWETVTPQSLGWNTNNINDLYTFLEQRNTRAFLVLKDGKIVIEKYFGNDLINRPFTANGVWYWASAGKTLTAF
jgi:hypothetical protein